MLGASKERIGCDPFRRDRLTVSTLEYHPTVIPILIFNINDIQPT